MMKKKLLIPILLLHVLVFALLWWLGRAKPLLDMIPARSKAVVRLSEEAATTTDFAAHFASFTGLPTNKADVRGEAYLFVTPNEYFGVAVRLSDADALLAALPTNAVTEEDGAHWIWTDSGWLAMLHDETLIALGPATAMERERLRHTLQVMADAPADEGFGHTPQAEALQNDAPMAFVASTKVLPAPYGSLMRLALPGGGALIAGSGKSVEQGFVVTGGLWENGTTRPAASEKPLPTTAFDKLLTGAFRMDGPELLRRLRADGSARMLLTALNDTATASATIGRMRGISAIAVSSLDTVGNAQFRLEGRDEQGSPVVLQSQGMRPIDGTSLQLNADERALLVVRTVPLLQSPLPEQVLGVLQRLFGGFQQITLRTTVQGGFCMTFTE